MICLETFDPSETQNKRPDETSEPIYVGHSSQIHHHEYHKQDSILIKDFLIEEESKEEIKEIIPTNIQEAAESEDEGYFSDYSPRKSATLYETSDMNKLLEKTLNKTPNKRKRSFENWKLKQRISKRSKPANFLFHELFDQQSDRIRKQSVFGSLKSWKLIKLIVKTNDDLR